MAQRAALARLARARSDGAELVLADPRWAPAVRAHAEAALGVARADGRLGPGTLVAFSSGSTSMPKGIVRSHASWEAGCAPLTELTGIGPGDVVALPGPLSSSLFAYGAWHAVSVGADVRTADEDQDDATAIHCVPQQLRVVVAERARGRWSRLRVVVCAGDALPAALRERAEHLGLVVVEYYGAAELSFVAVRTDAGPLRPFPGVECAVRDGLLWVRAPWTMTDYLDTARGGALRRDGDWCTVGDLATGDGAGFHLRGRGDLAITTGGHTVTVEEVERGLREVPGVDDAVAVGRDHPRLGQSVAAAVSSELPEEQVLAAVREALREWPAPSRPRRVAVLRALPRLPSGKVDRRAVEAMLRA